MRRTTQALTKLIKVKTSELNFVSHSGIARRSDLLLRYVLRYVVINFMILH